MALIADMVLEVSRQLNDQDNSTSAGPYFRWSIDDLMEYFNDAVVQVVNLCPHLAIANTNVSINVSGTRHQLPSQIMDLIAVNYATLDPRASTEEVPLLRVDSGFVKTFRLKSRPTGFNYRPYNWAYEPTEPNFVNIYPPVPAGVFFSINVTYRGIPQRYYGTSGSVPFDDKYHQPIVSWMQARAYEVDQESESSKALAVMHRTDFFKMMKAIIDADQALHAGTYRAPGRRK